MGPRLQTRAKRSKKSFRNAEAQCNRISWVSFDRQSTSQVIVSVVQTLVLARATPFNLNTGNSEGNFHKAKPTRYIYVRTRKIKTFFFHQSLCVQNESRKNAASRSPRLFSSQTNVCIVVAGILSLVKIQLAFGICPYRVALLFCRHFFPYRCFYPQLYGYHAIGKTAWIW